MPPANPPATGLRAIILAAGVGRRLGASGAPKILLAFGGATLLSRHIGILSRAGVADITLVAGFAADDLAEALGRLDLSCPTAILINPDFREGSVVSLWTARDVLRSGHPILLMDADVLYDDRLMTRLLTSAHANCLLLDREIEPGDEPVKLCLAGGRIVDFRKRPSVPHEWHGESVGFFRFDGTTAAELADRADDYVRGGRRALEYEEPIRDMILHSAPGRFGYEDISGLPWTEIDFPEDVTKANAIVAALA